jgi:hypothetical protein
MRKTLGYMALGSAAWRGFRWYRGRKASSQRWGLNPVDGRRNDLEFGDDIDLRSSAEESSALRRERWE